MFAVLIVIAGADLFEREAGECLGYMKTTTYRWDDERDVFVLCEKEYGRTKTCQQNESVEQDVASCVSRRMINERLRGRGRGRSEEKREPEQRWDG